MVYDLFRSSAWAARFHRPHPIAHPTYAEEFSYRERCQPRADKRVKVTSAENQLKHKVSFFDAIRRNWLHIFFFIEPNKSPAGYFQEKPP